MVNSFTSTAIISDLAKNWYLGWVVDPSIFGEWELEQIEVIGIALRHEACPIIFNHKPNLVARQFKHNFL